MGIVYVVYDYKWFTVLAAKTFQDELFACRPEIADRFIQEATAWINLDVHENVTRARFVQMVQSKPFLFLEYVQGGDLSTWIGTPRLIGNLPQVLRFGIQLCDGMKHAFSKGIQAHRDIKPQNCLIMGRRALKVTDLGLARVAASQEREGGRGGTPEYMAPEQWDNFDLADERADIYSTGAMLYEMLAGQPPFGRRPEVSLSELERLHKKRPAVLDRIPLLDSILGNCLAKDPDSRFQSFTTLRDRLAELYERETGEQAPQPATGANLDAIQLSNKGSSLDLLGRQEEAVSCFDRALEINPNDTWTLTNKAVALKGLGRNEEAVECCDCALTLNPRDEVACDVKGNALSALGRTEEALVCYDRAIEINPLNAEAWYNKGHALASETSRLAEEIACYERAIELNPSFEEAWYNKGIALWKNGRADDAIDCYDRVLALNSGHVDALNNKAVALGELGRREEEMACLERALEINPLDADVWHNKGYSFMQLGRLQHALACFDRAIELDANYAKAELHKGIVLGDRLRRWREAIVCYERALDIDPAFAEAWHNKGVALGALGRIPEALVCFTRATELNPQFAQAWFNRGAALKRLGRGEEARACFDEAWRNGFQ